MMSVQRNEYQDLKGQCYSLAGLDQRERELIEDFQQRAVSGIEWNEFGNYWMGAIHDFYRARGLSRQQILETIAFRVAQDLDSRLGITSGKVRPADYRDELEQLIRTRFKTRRSFCEATGLSEDMLSHVLSKRKNLAIDTLADALARVGYTLHIAEAPTSGVI
jgi:hypothetical protein